MLQHLLRRYKDGGRNGVEDEMKVGGEETIAVEIRPRAIIFIFIFLRENITSISFSLWSH